MDELYVLEINTILWKLKVLVKGALILKLTFLICQIQKPHEQIADVKYVISGDCEEHISNWDRIHNMCSKYSWHIKGSGDTVKGDLGPKSNNLF